MLPTKNPVTVGGSLYIALPQDFIKSNSLTNESILGYVQSKKFVIFLTEYSDEVYLRKILNLIEQ